MYCNLAFIVLLIGVTINADEENDLPHHTPYTIPTNRQYDGYSSVSPFTLTSPYFPTYSGPLAEGYNTRSVDYATTELESSHSFTVHANKLWNPSGITISRYSHYTLTVEQNDTNTWSEYNTISASANGFITTYDAIQECYVVTSVALEDGQEINYGCTTNSYLNKSPRIPAQPWLALICCISADYYSNVVLSTEMQERVMPMTSVQLTESCFPVPATGISDLRAQESGQLLCFANDRYGMYWNNIGSQTVLISLK